MTEEPARPPIDWKSITDELADYGRDLATRLSGRTRANARRAQEGEYRVDNLLEDVKDFWKYLAEDVERGVDCWRANVLRRTDVD
jgi:hypothetical protein